MCEFFLKNNVILDSICFGKFHVKDHNSIIIDHFCTIKVLNNKTGFFGHFYIIQLKHKKLVQ